VTDVLLVAEQLRRSVPGGIGTYIRGLLQGFDDLVSAGEDVPDLTLYASRPRNRHQGPSSGTDSYSSGSDSLTTWRRPVRVSPLPSALLTRGWDSGALDVPRAFPVVHAPSLATPPCRHARLVVAVHDTAWRHVPEVYSRRGRTWHEAALRRAVHRASAVVVPAEAVAADAVAAGFDPDQVHVVALGSDHLPLPDAAGAAAVLRHFGIDGPFLLSVGTLEPRKNLGRLFEAYNRARSSLPGPWPLVVVGPAGWGKEPSVPISPGIMMTGAVSDAILAALYGRATLLAYVPLVEGFGLPPLEAMAAGAPVVASPMPSIGEAAWVVDPTDVDAIAGGLAEVASDDELRARLSAAGRARAGSHRWADSARRHLAVWEAGG